MQDQLITFETAKLANEKGFNYPTNVMFENGKLNYGHTNEYGIDEQRLAGIHPYNNKEWLSCPTQSLLQKWLREEHQIIIDIATDCTSEPKYVYSIYVFKGNPRDLAEREWGWYFHKQEDWCLDYTYEDALEAGLKEALSLINKDLKFE